MSDLNFQNFSTVQNANQPQPNTIASAATITLTTFLTYVTGTTQVATITPPVGGQCFVALVFTDNSPGTFLTNGNVAQAIVPTTNIPCFLIYDPALGKWQGCANNIT